jgi:hypothetical protein
MNKRLYKIHYLCLHNKDKLVMEMKTDCYEQVTKHMNTLRVCLHMRGKLQDTRIVSAWYIVITSALSNV